MRMHRLMAAQAGGLCSAARACTAGACAGPDDGHALLHVLAIEYTALMKLARRDNCQEMLCITGCSACRWRGHAMAKVRSGNESSRHCGSIVHWQWCTRLLSARHMPRTQAFLRSPSHPALRHRGFTVQEASRRTNHAAIALAHLLGNSMHATAISSDAMIAGRAWAG